MDEIIKNDMYKINLSLEEKEKLKNSKFLITGANSSLSQYLIHFLMHLNMEENYNIEINALVRNGEKAKNIFYMYSEEDINYIIQDVCEPIKMEGEIDYIIHTAGSASPRFILNDPVGVINANTMGTVSVLNFAKEKNIKNLLFTSTREIYGKLSDDVEVIYEDMIGGIDTLDARSCYPESKRAAETILKAYNIQDNIPFNIARIAHTYGPGMEINNDGRIMADLVSFGVHGEDIRLSSDGTAMRSFCYITDTASGMFKILLSGENAEAYNLANETEPKPIKETAELIIGLYPDKNMQLFLNDAGNFKGGYTKGKFLQMSTKKLESLGWKPEVKLEEGLYNTINYNINKIYGDIKINNRS